MKKYLKVILPSLLILGMQMSVGAASYAIESGVNSATGEGTSGAHTIKGATQIDTDDTTSYAVDIWADDSATYTYKKVTKYSASDAGFADVTTLTDEENPEKGYSTGAGWIGFNGIKNRITVVNKSNAEIQFNATAAKAENAFADGVTTPITFTQNAETNVKKEAYKNFGNVANASVGSQKFGNAGEFNSATAITSADVADQSNPTYYYKEIYYSISGEPKAANKTSGDIGTIGTVTLTFSAASGT